MNPCASFQLEGRTVGLIVLYTVGAITMVIAILGAYGAHRENRACLIVVGTEATGSISK